MNTIDALRRIQTAERRRRVLIVLAFVLPWALVVAIGAGWGRESTAWLSTPIAPLMQVALVTLALRLAWRSAGAVDDTWLSRQMDAQRRDLEDSAALLFPTQGDPSALERLQQARLQERVRRAPLPDVRTPWPLRPLAAGGLLAIAVVTVATVWSAMPRDAVIEPGAPDIDAAAGQTRILGRALEVQPPAYTGLPTRRLDTLQAKVPEGSTLSWRLRFAPQPESAELVFHDGTRQPMQQRGTEWTASRQVKNSTFYRVRLTSALPLPAARPYRIDVIADRPPQIRVIQPDRTLVVLERKQAHWPLAFEASDDFGLSAAQLRITLAQGSGENIAVSARTLTLPGQGDARRRTYRHQLDLGALGFAVGDDLVVRLSISDQRVPSAQTTRSSSFILRWPPDAGAEATAVEVLVKRALPAYFRSQRQIIIDSEALLARRRKVDAAKYLQSADEIGVDQRLLRLKYGQFLGQETSEAPRSPAPKAVADGPAASEAAASAESSDAHGHDGSAGAAPAVAGNAAEAMAVFGHIHDQPEAATLLDPDTRALLKSALDEMWQAELHLRQGNVDTALPYEYRALRFIKQVQQASRIYLARVGSELPPIDESRRLSGDRKGLQSQRDALQAAQLEASPALALWQALEMGQVSSASAELEAFEQWLRARESTLPGAMDLFAALDAVRLDPNCVACATTLRNRLWPLLPTRAPVVESRRVPDRSGRAYLESLNGGPDS